ncbi:ribosomal maturation YjgA family protein [Emticicia fontis]
MLTFRPKYGLLAIVFFVIEVLIAVYVHDSFVRPIVGDYLVVFLVYCAVFTFWNTHFLTAAIATLLFAYLIETLQYFHFVHLMGWEKYKILAIALGTGFSWIDMIAYTLGFLTIVWVESRRARTPQRQSI